MPRTKLAILCPAKTPWALWRYDHSGVSPGMWSWNAWVTNILLSLCTKATVICILCPLHGVKWPLNAGSYQHVPEVWTINALYAHTTYQLMSHERGNETKQMKLNFWMQSGIHVDSDNDDDNDDNDDNDGDDNDDDNEIKLVMMMVENYDCDDDNDGDNCWWRWWWWWWWWKYSLWKYFCLYILKYHQPSSVVYKWTNFEYFKSWLEHIMQSLEYYSFLVSYYRPNYCNL